MKKEFIPYEQALALKELEFDEPCVAFYYGQLNRLEIGFNWLNEGCKNSLLEDIISAPLYQQAFRWFREKHRLFHNVERESAQEYFCNYSIKEFDGIKNIDHRGKGYRYEEEAELACLNKLIEIVKNAKNSNIEL